MHDLGPAPRGERLGVVGGAATAAAAAQHEDVGLSGRRPAAAVSPAVASHACRSAHAAAGTAVVLGPKMAAVLCASGVLRSSSKPPPPDPLPPHLPPPSRPPNSPPRRPRHSRRPPGCRLPKVSSLTRCWCSQRAASPRTSPTLDHNGDALSTVVVLLGLGS